MDFVEYVLSKINPKYQVKSAFIPPKNMAADKDSNKTEFSENKIFLKIYN